MGAYPGPKHLGYSVHSLREKSSNDYRWGFGGLQSLAAAAGRKTTSHSRRRRSGRPPGDRPAMALTASGLSPALPWGREWPSSRRSSASSHKEEAYRWLQKGLDAP